ncbi:MAG TPA: sigma-70 family RNA polymerase sigma factor [Fimbriiglobus sp.]|jgi:RNA polymerase sigma-70 factor (ECF subfamily)
MVGKARDSEFPTSASLLLRVRNPQDSDAWQMFEGIYRPLVLRYCRRRGLQEADAADVAQEVFARVAGAIRGFDYAPERGRFRSWLGTITIHQIHTFQARAGRSPTSGADPAGPAGPADPDPDWMTEFTEHVLAVASERIRGEFEPETWNVFEAVWVRQERPADIARRLGIAVHAVYVSKSRVLKRLEAEVLHLAEDMPLAQHAV